MTRSALSFPSSIRQTVSFWLMMQDWDRALDILGALSSMDITYDMVAKTSVAKSVRPLKKVAHPELSNAGNKNALLSCPPILFFFLFPRRLCSPLLQRVTVATKLIGAWRNLRDSAQQTSDSAPTSSQPDLSVHPISSSACPRLSFSVTTSTALCFGVAPPCPPFLSLSFPPSPRGLLQQSADSGEKVGSVGLACLWRDLRSHARLLFVRRVRPTAAIGTLA